MAKPGRKPGTPRTGGRLPGTPNKRTRELEELLAEVMGEDFDPVVRMAQIAEDPATSPELRVRCLAEIAPYLRPRRKAIENTGGMSLEQLLLRSVTGVPESAMSGGNDRHTPNARAAEPERVSEPVPACPPPPLRLDLRPIVADSPLSPKLQRTGPLDVIQAPQSYADGAQYNPL